jgi:DNA repair exonuclease SbcCD ATPase subunit
MGLALVVAGCASASLMPPGQAQAIKDRERALAVHAEAIQTAISQSGQIGALAFLDTGDSHLVVLPGSSPADAWARFATSPEGGTGRRSVPPVLTFVHRADMPKAPEAVTLSDLEQQQALRGSLTALDTDLRQERQRLEERLSMVERGLAEAVTAAKRESDASLASRTELQKELSSLSQDLAAARTLLRQTTQLATLNQEANAENASGIRKMATASQELAASSARLEETVRKLSETLATQFEELAKRLDSIQGGKADTGK